MNENKGTLFLQSVFGLAIEIGFWVTSLYVTVMQ
jgi:hypothetical protein